MTRFYRIVLQNFVTVILRLAISSHVCINCICRTQSFLKACMEGKYSHFFFLCGIIVSKKGIEAKKKKILDMSDPGDFVNCSRRIRAKNLFEKQFFTFLFMLSHTNLCLSGNGIYQFIHF